MKSDKHFFFFRSWSGDRIGAAVDLLLVRFENVANCMEMTLRESPSIPGDDLNFVWRNRSVLWEFMVSTGRQDV